MDKNYAEGVKFAEMTLDCRRKLGAREILDLAILESANIEHASDDAARLYFKGSYDTFATALHDRFGMFV